MTQGVLAVAATLALLGAACSTASTQSTATSDSCSVELEGDDVAAALAGVLACDGDLFRASFRDDVSITGTDLDDRLGECVRGEIDDVSDDELFALAQDSETVDEFARLFGELIGTRCQGALGNLGALDPLALIDSVVRQTGTSYEWSAPAIVDLGPGTALASAIDGLTLFVATDENVEQVIAATLVLEPSLINEDRSVPVLEALLDALGARSAAPEAAAVMSGQASPDLPPLRVCSARDAGLVVVIVQESAVPCLDP